MATQVKIGAESRADSLALAREVVFSPVADGAVVEQTVRRLGEAIGLGLIEVGERLPPEAELAARFAIAPMTLREALRILREAGYLETRRGRGGGTFVKRSLPQRPAGEARPWAHGSAMLEETSRRAPQPAVRNATPRPTDLEAGD